MCVRKCARINDNIHIPVSILNLNLDFYHPARSLDSFGLHDGRLVSTSIKMLSKL